MNDHMSNDIEYAARPGMSDEVLYARDGHLGRILLNRPKVINVLTAHMVTSVLAQLEDWAPDNTVAAVSIQGAGERGLCAGADVRALRSVLMQGSAGAVQFWADEYRMNAAIDGLNPFGVFWRLIVPLARPGLAVAAFYTFLTAWGEVAYASHFLLSEGKYTLAVGLQTYVSQFNSQWNYMAATAVMIAIPAGCVFYLVQRHLVAGLTAGGTKG